MSTNPYDEHLDKNPANYQPLTPLPVPGSAPPPSTPITSPSFTATQRFTYARVLRALPAAGLGAGGARHRPGRHRLGDARQHAADAGGPLRRADDGRACCTRSTRGSMRRIVAFQLDHADAKVVISDREFAPVMKDALALAKVKPRRHRLRRPGVPADGEQLVRPRLRGVRRKRRSGLRLANAGGRVGRDRAQLHLGHDRQPQGRRLPPPRRGPHVLREHARDAHGQAPGLSVDAADVPLQRLVLSVDAVGRGRHARVPALGAREGDVRRHRRAHA